MNESPPARVPWLAGALSVLGGRRLDLALGALGVLFGAVSVALPFGRDQGLYYFVGREWLQHGEMPYRDAFEQKTPAIFFVHAVAIALFGEHMWSIRVLELGCVLALGLVCARLAVAMGEAVPSGIYGVSVLAAAVLYIGFFDFWSTAQCEIWCTTAAMASACASMRMRRESRAALAGGLLAGVAFVFKPPVAPLVGLVGLGLIARVWRAPEQRLRRVASAAVSFGTAFVAPGAVVLVYFAAKGALPAMVEVLVDVNAYYVKHEVAVRTLFDVAQRSHDVYKLWDPVSSLLLEALVVAIVVGIARRDRVLRDRHLFALAACLAAFLGVVSQLKFYLYHWGIVVGPATLVASNVALDAVALGRWRMPARGAAIATCLFAVNLLGAFGLTGRCANKWLEEVASTTNWLTGRINREEFTRGFEVEGLGYKLHDAEQVGLWLREHTSPSDEVAVRSFEPEIYAIARRRYGGRFFWTSFLTDPRRAYKRAEWLAQDRTQLEERRPRWVVAVSSRHEGPDATEYFVPMGYVVRAEVTGFSIMERMDAVDAR